MHHTIAWRKSQADATEEQTTPVTDGILAISQSGNFLPTYNYLIPYLYFGAATPTSARLVTPTFRQITTPFIRPLNPAIVPSDEPNIADYRANPLKTQGLEELQLLSTQTSGGAAVVVAVGALMTSMPVMMPQGNVYTLRGVGATTLVAGGWTQAAITWQDTLPAGQYVVVGLGYIGTTAVAARVIFENQVERPGAVAVGANTSSGSSIFMKGGLGVWGYFNANRMPNLEFLANAADTAETVYMDIIRVA